MDVKKFEVDRTEAKLLGVCAGLGAMMAIDPTIVRIGFVVATIVGGWPWTVIAYIALGFYGQARRGGQLHRRRREAGCEVRDFDRRLAEIDSYVASSNSRLAREIEELR
jgi:phage shock protein C